MTKSIAVLTALWFVTAAGLLGVAGSSHADTITGDLEIGGFPSNFYDPANGVAPASANAGYSNASSPTVTVTSYPITFGFNGSTNPDFFSLDVTTFTATSLTYQETPANGEQALRILTFTSSPGFFDSFTVVSDNFTNGGITDSVSADGSMVTLNWAGGFVSNTNTFEATFAGTPLAVPGPIAGAGLPGLMFATGGVIAWWRRKKKAAAG
jgi:hypothetical protein